MRDGLKRVAAIDAFGLADAHHGGDFGQEGVQMRTSRQSVINTWSYKQGPVDIENYCCDTWPYKLL